MKSDIYLATIVESVGVDLRQAGQGRLRGKCPFHEEKTGSFFVFTDQQRWHCFGCGEKGDAIDFVRRLRGCSFPEALSYLGIESPKKTSVDFSRLKTERRKRDAARWREREVSRTIGRAILICRKALDRITPENFDSPIFSIILQNLSQLEFQHNALIYGGEATRAAVVSDWNGIVLFKRKLLFRHDFDYAGWVRSIFTSTAHMRGNGELCYRKK